MVNWQSIPSIDISIDTWSTLETSCLTVSWGSTIIRVGQPSADYRLTVDWVLISVHQHLNPVLTKYQSRCPSSVDWERGSSVDRRYESTLNVLWSNNYWVNTMKTSANRQSYLAKNMVNSHSWTHACDPWDSQGPLPVVVTRDGNNIVQVALTHLPKYLAYALTCPGSMQIYWNKRIQSFYKIIRKELNSHRIGLVHQHGCRFNVLELMCIRSISLNHFNWEFMYMYC